jgi:hypothetical protein
MRLNVVYFFLVSVNFFFMQNEIFAQPQLWEIYTNSNQPFVNVFIDKYESDSLYIKSMDQMFIFHHDSIKYLLRKNESNFGLGFIIGAVLGGIFGNALSKDGDGSYDLGFSAIGRLSFTILGIVVGGTLGGLAGLSAGTDNKYRIDKLSTENKRDLLNKLFN